MRVSGGRRRFAATLAALAASALLASGCGGDSREPDMATATLRLVPANALVALHLSTDRRRGAVRAGARTAGRLPSWRRLQRDLLRRVSARGCGIDLRGRPGKELTFALLPARRGASTPLLVTDAPATGVGEAPSPCGALAAAKVGGLVVIGEPAGLLAVAEVAAGRRRSLTASPVYRRAASALPADRVLDAWASVRGTRDLIGPLGGLYSTLAGFVDAPGLRGAVAALVPRSDGASLVIRRVAVSSARVAPFRPTLQRQAPAGALTYAAAGDLGSALQRLLLLAAPGARVGDRSAGPSLAALGRLGRESATVVAPGRRGPVITLLSRVGDPRAVRRAMTALEPELARLVGAPQSATWSDATPAGAQARTLADAPGQALSWAMAGTTLIVSTSLEGIGAIRAGGPSLASTRGFQAATGDLRSPVTSLVFLDPNQLLRLGADTGIGPVGALEGNRKDLAKVRAIGVTTAGTSRQSTVDLSLWIP